MDPIVPGPVAHTLGLVRRQDGELDPQRAENLERLHVHGQLWQPQPFGIAVEAVLEIANAPQDLRVLMAGTGQRQDDVVVRLRQRRSVAGEQLQALAVGFQNALVGAGRVLFQPGKQSGAEIKADAGVVVDDFGDAPLPIQNAGGAVGHVALVGDALVPVVVRRGGILQLDGFQPGILAGRLIKMRVDAEITVHGSGVSGKPQPVRAQPWDERKSAGELASLWCLVHWSATGLAEGTDRPCLTPATYRGPRARGERLIWYIGAGCILRHTFRRPGWRYQVPASCSISAANACW